MFFIGINNIITNYSDLVNYIFSEIPIQKKIKETNTLNFFLNFTKSLYYNQDIILIDSNISDGEDTHLLERLHDDDYANYEYEKSGDLEKIINGIRNSNSNITLFTSGTTGQPKKVTHNIKTLTREIRTGPKFEDNIWGFTYNPTHMAGLQVFFQALLNKNLIIDLSKFSKDRIFKCINELNITHLSATPTFYRLLIPSSESFQTIKRVTIGGEKSSNTIQDSLRKLFPHAIISNIYASTEAGALLSSHNEGFFIPENKKEVIKIINEELVLHNSVIANIGEGVLVEDWYFTGDVIEWIDIDKGIFKFISRKNEMINTGGYKVNPNEVEEFISAIEGVVNVVVFAKANSVLGNILCCNIQKVSNSQLDVSTVKKHLSNKLQTFKIPRIINFVEYIETTRTGKIKRNNL